MRIELTKNKLKLEYIKDSSNTPILSILICTLQERKTEFLDKILSILKPQISEKDVEIIILTDNGEIPIGTKRNVSLDSANGKYVCFVDDDDIVSESYVDLILSKAKEDSDVIVFSGIVTTNGWDIKLARQGMEYEYGEVDGVYYRLPNHLAIHKKETMVERFMDVRTGEDDEWAQRRLKEINTQSRIDEILYHYDFRTTTKKYFI
jgi:glycosyltransferase involved in cell wall biosynthesis